MDPILNPYTPGAGSRPPALTGRDEEIHAFRILLERIRQGRAEKSLLITGLRGVGKTVLLGSAAKITWIAPPNDLADRNAWRGGDSRHSSATGDGRRIPRTIRRAS
jgi:hypothetical protein